MEQLERLSLSEIESKPKIVVGLDFGTTFSGFAYALASEPVKIRKFYEWPDLKKAGANNYCKTRTSLLYAKGEAQGSYILKAWGYSAVSEYADKMRESRSQGTTSGSKGAGQEYFLVEKFKLLLAGKGQALADSQLPDGLTAKGVISDYLRKIADFILVLLRGKFGACSEK